MPVIFTGQLDRGHLVTKKRYYFFTLINMFSQLVVLYLSQNYRDFQSTSFVVRQALYFNFRVQCWNQVFCLIISTTTKDSFVENVKLLDKFDRQVKLMGVEGNFNEHEFRTLRKFHIRSNLVFVTVAISTTLLFFYEPTNYKYLIQEGISLSFCVFNLTYFSLFCISQRAVGNRYQKLNTCFK